VKREAKSEPSWPNTGEMPTLATLARLSASATGQRPEVPGAGAGNVTTVEPFQFGRAARMSNRPAIVRARPDDCRVKFCEIEAERNNLRADLAEALEQVEHWRTLAEYRGSRLVERQERQTGDRC
jgi:hypothetical protein